MSIPGLSVSIPLIGEAIIDLLAARFRARHPILDDFQFRLYNTASLKEGLERDVTLYLYRVRAQPAPHQGRGRWADRPRSSEMMVELRYLLTVWCRDVVLEQTVLTECMSILDDHPIIDGEFRGTESEDWALEVQPDFLSHEEMLRLWEALSPAYRLSVPYVVNLNRRHMLGRASAHTAMRHLQAWVPRSRSLQ